MSLFDRYDQNEAELFLRNTCFVTPSQRRFEDLFEQIHQHFPQSQIFSNSEECLKIRENLSVEHLDLNHQYTTDIFLESISHLLVFNLVRAISPFHSLSLYFDK